VFRPLANHTLVFKGQKVFEPNKFGFLSVIFFAPVFICLIGYPLIADFKVLILNYTTVLALGFNFLAYHTICDAEHTYRNNQIKDILLTSLTPLNLPKGIRGVHKVFRNKYNFNEQRAQIEFADLMCGSLGLHEFARLVGDCRALGNLTPLVNPVCPNLDLRTKIDDFHNIRISEWRGYYPGSIRSGSETTINK